MIRNLRDYWTIKRSRLFDPIYYLSNYPDVRRADVDPLWHFVTNGWEERRNPNPRFDVNYYIGNNADVKNAETNPLVHYIKFGKKESRLPSNNSNYFQFFPQNSVPKQVYGTRNTVRKAYNYYKLNGFNALITKVIKKTISLVRIKINKQKMLKFARNSNRYFNQYNKMLNIASSTSDEYVAFSVENPHIDKQGVKLIAFYLPQFHPIPENDRWWGRGFTEWTNVSKTVPQFENHYQPHLPGELGFYDLRIPEVQKRQVELAKNYGIYGFCFHYYWFKGKRLLEGPIESFIHNPEIDFPFCICWANENWTRRWDGLENDILIAQEHSDETDLDFIHDVIPLFKHKNYITIDGHPILIVYRVSLLPDAQKTATLWKKKCIEAGIKEPYLIAAQTFGFTDPKMVGFDAAVEFPPHNISAENITDQVNLLNLNYSGNVYRYSGKASLSELYLTMEHTGYKAFKTVTPGWDNEPRKPGKGTTFAFSSPESYKKWLLNVCNIVRNNTNPAERIVFINAWNEWGEGAHLEPDRKYGYAYLKATSDTLKQYS